MWCFYVLLESVGFLPQSKDKLVRLADCAQGVASNEIHNVFRLDLVVSY